MKNALRHGSWAALALLSCTSCAALKEMRCNTGYADAAGYADARKGESQKPARADGQICEEGYSYAQFQRDYDSGFQRGVAEICRTEEAQRAGLEDGRAGRESFPSLPTFAVCRAQPDAPALEAAYRAAFQQAFCTDERARALAEQDAELLQARSAQTAFAPCGDRLPAVAEAYRRSFELALQRQCTPARAFALGVADARAGTDGLAGARRLESCPRDSQLELLQSYRQGFNDTSRTLAREKEAALSAEADRRAEQERQQREQQRAARLSQRTIKAQGRDLYVQCLIEDGQAHVTVANPVSGTASLSPRWSIRFLNHAQVFLRADTTLQSLIIFGGQSGDFRVSAPQEARYCIADVLEPF